MNIGFDAKRAFHNNTGLGHYSRTLINSLAKYYNQNQYFLFNPKISNYYKPQFQNIHTITPQGFINKKLNSLWRSNFVKKEIVNLKIDIYHGLSHEIPICINKLKCKTVVTIHDLIFERYPEQYNKIDVAIYRKKFMYACKNANHIVAISKQTKQDIIDFYKIDEKKITICYQSCNENFATKINSIEKKRIQQLYSLPPKYFLYVGSIIERKNLMTICKAINILKNKISIPLVVIGNGDEYLQKVKEYIKQNNIEHLIIFLSENKIAKKSTSFKNANDFPAIYQNAIAMIYPSIFEGFGIPVLEALWSRLPVITSNISCLPEAGGPGSILINPLDENAMADAMFQLFSNENKRIEMIDAGWEYANLFTNERCADNIMQVYEKVLSI